MLKVLKSFLILFVITCSGCALFPPPVPYVPLSAENKAQIKSIWVDQTDNPKKMFIDSKSGNSASFLLGGLIGETIYQSEKENDAKYMENYAKGNNVDLTQIVYEQIQTQFKEKLPFKINDKSQNIKLNTKILKYGLMIPRLFSSNYVPYIQLNCQLIKDNQLIMDITVETQLKDQYSKEDLLKDPKNLWMMWDKASEEVVAQLVENLK